MTWLVPGLVIVAVVGGFFAIQQFSAAPESGALSSVISHAQWDGLLQAYVDDNGRVDYAAMKTDPRLDAYLTRLRSTRAAGLATANDRLAFWINAYNALTIRAVLDTLPADRQAWPEYRISEQIIDGTTLWKGRTFEVGGERHTLDEIENDILRKRDGLRDPRIHAALVCAARGCPALWNHAYSGAKVREELSDAMRRFANSPRQLRWDDAQQVFHVSKIIDWYGGDFSNPTFEPHAKRVGAFLADYVDDPAIAKRLRGESVRFVFNDYDWRLNIQQTPSTMRGE